MSTSNTEDRAAKFDEEVRKMKLYVTVFWFFSWACMFAMIGLFLFDQAGPPLYPLFLAAFIPVFYFPFALKKREAPEQIRQEYIATGKLPPGRWTFGRLMIAMAVILTITAGGTVFLVRLRPHFARHAGGSWSSSSGGYGR